MYNGLSDSENIKYGSLSLLIIISICAVLGSFGFLVFTFVMSMVYWFNNDTLTCVQIFKLYLFKYILGFVAYLISVTIMKNSYRSWKKLKDKEDEYNNKLHLVK